MPMLELVQRVRWPFAASAAALLQPPAWRPLTDDTFTVRHQRHQMRLISLNFTMPSFVARDPSSRRVFAAAARCTRAFGSPTISSLGPACQRPNLTVLLTEYNGSVK